jgi:putative aminopeptidase FrvX
VEQLLALLALPGVCGDEGPIADWLENELRSLSGVVSIRLSDSIIALRGTPRVAIFAHIDTTGFTLGYDCRLLPIGDPSPKEGDRVRPAAAVVADAAAEPQWGTIHLRNKHGDDLRLRRMDGPDCAGTVPGTRWIYDRPPQLDDTGEILTAPYLDNRAGVWCALRALERCENIAVAFTTGEEQHGHGARVCVDWLYRERGITQALIADMTWHTRHTPRGSGPVISLRDACCPRQAFLERVLALAEVSGIPFQREIQDEGSSDGGYLLRSSVPIDWAFVGAPQKKPHTSRESVALSDLEAMTDLLTHLGNRL